VFDTSFSDSDGRVVKIGRSANPNFRIGELTQGNPFGKMLFAGFVGRSAMRMEADFHMMFREKWIQREMFRLSEFEIDRMKSILRKSSTKWIDF